MNVNSLNNKIFFSSIIIYFFVGQLRTKYGSWTIFFIEANIFLKTTGTCQIVQKFDIYANGLRDLIIS